MTSTRRLAVAAGLLGLSAVVGILTRGESLMVPRPEEGALRGARAVVHGELEHGHVDVAVRVWHDAYGAALESGNWESMIAVGDAFMAIGRASGTPAGARMNAREAYLTALIRARRDRSVDGALRSAEAFRQLNDHAVVEQCLHIAAQLAAGDEQAQEKVREARQH